MRMAETETKDMHEHFSLITGLAEHVWNERGTRLAHYFTGDCAPRCQRCETCSHNRNAGVLVSARQSHAHACCRSHHLRDVKTIQHF